jgi:hypothetical protein
MPQGGIRTGSQSRVAKAQGGTPLREAIRYIDVFNGDADGLCALQQLRLAEPADSVLVTGVKRDIALLERVAAGAGDLVTVLDISLDTNRGALARLLESGARIRYFDHHFAGEIPIHPNCEVDIDPSPLMCTSALVDRHLDGRYRTWAAVAAFGDGLPTLGERLAAQCGLSGPGTERLARLGECLNYNSYGESVADLHQDPAQLAQALRPYRDPLEFVAHSPTYPRLREGFDEDMRRAASLRAEHETPTTALFTLPDASWARRVIGVFANRVAQENPGRAHAILSPNSGGGYTVSVRAPVANPVGADALCRQFPSGGGRAAAAGINHLPKDDLPRFAAALDRHFSSGR